MSSRHTPDLTVAPLRSSGGNSNGKTCPNFLVYGNAFARLNRYSHSVAHVLIQRSGLLAAVDLQHHMPIIDKRHCRETRAPPRCGASLSGRLQPLATKTKPSHRKVGRLAPKA